MIGLAHTEKTLALAFAGFYAYSIVVMGIMTIALKKMRKDED